MERGLLLLVCSSLVIACGSKDPQPGACVFENAAAQPYEGFPPQIGMCLSPIAKAECSLSGLRKPLKKLPTKMHEFKPGETCESIAFSRCPTAINGVTHREPCDAPAAGSAAAPAGTAPAFAMPAAEPGPVYVALGTNGLAVILPDGTPQIIANVRGWTKELTRGADGNVYVAVDPPGDGQAIDVLRLDGATATKVGRFKAYTNTALAIAKDGTIYGAENARVMKAGDKTSTNLPALAGAQVIKELSFDAEGRLVAADRGQIHILNGEAWTSIQIPGAREYERAWLIGSGETLVVAPEHKPFYTLRAGTLERLYPDVKDREVGTKKPSRSDNGVLAYYEVERGKARTRLIDAKGGTTTTARIAEGIAATVLDGQGRLWYVDDGALTVASAVTKDITEYPIGSLPALTNVGTSSGEGELLVVGGGPSKLPAVGAQQFVDQVTATILIGKTPLANTEVEICTFTSISYRSSPCEDSKSRKTAMTNDKGEVSFAQVPVGSYRLAWNEGGRWTLASGTFIDLTAPAPLKNLGKLRYK